MQSMVMGHEDWDTTCNFLITFGELTS